MRTLDQNLHVLLPQRDFQLLKKRASKDKKSVGELIRQAIRKCYGFAEPELKQAAFKRLSERSELAMEDWDRVKQHLLHRYE